jgi:hypothetical protein
MIRKAQGVMKLKHTSSGIEFIIRGKTRAKENDYFVYYESIKREVKTRPT